MAKIKPPDLLDILKDEFKLSTQGDTADFLGLTQGRISHIKNSKTITKNNIKTILRAAYNAGVKDAQADTNTLVIDLFAAMRGLKTQREIADAVAKTQGAIAQWKSGTAKLTKGLASTLLKESTPLKISSLFEMKMVEPVKPGKKWFLFKDEQDRTKLLDKVKDKQGVYCFFDSRGHISYIGKADKTPLNIEIENRLNQEVAVNRIRYWEGLKKPLKGRLRQGEFVKFISAYEVFPAESISLVEAILIRTTANTQFNSRLENL